MDGREFGLTENAERFRLSLLAPARLLAFPASLIGREAVLGTVDQLPCCSGFSGCGIAARYVTGSVLIVDSGMTAIQARR
jgi:hypothetical protein